MNQGTKSFVLIAFVAVLAALIYLVVAANWRDQSLFAVKQSGGPPRSAWVSTGTDQVEVGINQRSKSDHMRPGAGQKRYYEIVGSTKGLLELNESVVMDRVKAGLQCLRLGTLPIEEKRITSIRDAYAHLMKNASFMAGSEPLWGIEQEKYYVFSGGRDLKAETAFKQGHAVEKTSGRIYQWWLPEEKDSQKNGYHQAYCVSCAFLRQKNTAGQTKNSSVE